MKKIIFYLLPIILFCSSRINTVIAQTTSSIGAVSRVVRVINSNNTTIDKIQIRIAPVGDTITTSPGYVINSWQRYKSSGYKIERFRQGNNTVEATFNVIPNPTSLLQKANDTLTLNGDIRKKLIATASKKLYDALYQPMDSNTLAALSKNSDVNVYPYVMTIYASNLSFEASKLAGLAFVDETATDGVAYRYRISELATPQGGYIPYLDVNIVKIFSTLPSIVAPSGLFSSKYTDLKWRYRNPLSSFKFSSYWILRAESTGNFQIRNEIPYIPTINEAIQTDTTNYLDKLPAYKVLLRYKLIARTIFDEEVESPEMSGQCLDDNIYNPKITKSDLFGTNVNLVWKFPSDTLLANKANYINGYKIYKAPLDSTVLYQPIPINGSINNLVAINDTTFTIPNITTTTYIKIAAVNKSNGQLLYSAPVLVEPVDSTVNRPTNVVAVFNTAGKVNITWSASPDNDIIGYKVFRKNTLIANEEPSEITANYVNGLTYLDNMLKDTTVFKKDSTKFALSNRNYVYYIAAIDGHYNQSKLSDPAIARKPDDIRPTQPIIINYSITDKNVNLDYRKSYDDDILNHRLIRYELPAKIETVLTVDPLRDSTQHTFVDNTTEYNKTYAYVLIAKDSANNETMSNLITIQTTKNLKRPTISNFKALYDSLTNKINLTWEYQILPDFQEYELFRTEDTSAVSTIQTKLSLWKLANLNEISAIDDKIAYGKKIQYLIRAAYKDGTISDFSSISLLIKNPLLCKGLAWIYMNVFLKPTTYQLTEACEQVILEEGFGAEATDTGSVEIRTKQ